MSTPQGHTILLSQFFKLGHNTVSDTRGTFITRHQLSARANAVDKMKGIEHVIKNEKKNNITELHAYILHRGSPSFLSPNPAVKGKRIQSQR
jgi:hypothetical protein